MLFLATKVNHTYVKFTAINKAECFANAMLLQLEVLKMVC